MKLYKIPFLMIGAALLTTACSDIDEQVPEGGSLTKEQIQESNNAVPERMQATFANMFAMMGKPHTCWPTGGNSSRADDFGFISAALSLDLEGADMFMPNSNYNWFSTCSEYSTRNANYANPYMRYRVPYNQIGVCNEIIAAFPETTTDSVALNQMAQARAMRAFDYMSLAPYFQFSIASGAGDEPCVPILKDGVDYTNNPRATVQEVWDYILEDLNWAVAHLEKNTRTSKDKIDKNVALALRARANLICGKFAEAAADADAAMEGYTPATIAEIAAGPAFCNISEHNWIWGINITSEMVNADGYPTASSWIAGFSGDGYSGVVNPPLINVLLYNKIPATDVRKGWWLDADKKSPLLASLTWTDAKTGASASGNDIPDFEIEDVKIKYQPYSNVKFGQKSGVGSTVNNNDFPLIRVEEMILIKAEGQLKSGDAAGAKTTLENFVKTYRDPSYSADAAERSLADEIWYQRRVELWGEGFFVSDAKRLDKNIVRFHGAGTTNFPEAFTFNIEHNDGWLNMRFPNTEMNNNHAIVDNMGGEIPVANQNPTLRDGVTD